ncbi:MAG: dephospho-CoA kinase [Rhodospirillaceae bacterium]|nr:dephospho-CoA kinase [Rhodospirillaceae bacterium]
MKVRRPRARAPRILGLTGSIAMGKSTAAQMLRRLGVPVFDSDAAARAVTAPGGAAVAHVAARFPGVMKNGHIDRPTLAAQVFGAPGELAALERIVHPHVHAARKTFMAQATRWREPVVVFDIPLLFETAAEKKCDVVIVVTAPAFLQRQRALARPGMTAERLRGVLARQVPDFQKRRRADVIIPSGLGRADTYRRLKKTLRRVRKRIN